VALACAHPAKFPEAVAAATGQHPALPANLADLMTRRERITVLSNNLAAVQRFVADHARPVGHNHASAAPSRRAGGAA
jgi:threonine synthase